MTPLQQTLVVWAALLVAIPVALYVARVGEKRRALEQSIVTSFAAPRPPRVEQRAPDSQHGTAASSGAPSPTAPKGNER